MWGIDSKARHCLYQSQRAGQTEINSIKRGETESLQEDNEWWVIEKNQRDVTMPPGTKQSALILPQTH